MRFCLSFKGPSRSVVHTADGYAACDITALVVEAETTVLVYGEARADPPRQSRSRGCAFKILPSPRWRQHRQ
jgi:hypothetical protein